MTSMMYVFTSKTSTMFTPRGTALMQWTVPDVMVNSVYINMCFQAVRIVKCMVNRLPTLHNRTHAVYLVILFVNTRLRYGKKLPNYQ